MNNKRQKRYSRHRRIRAKIIGTEKHPRLSVFRSNKNIYVQLIDDSKSVTVLHSSDLKSGDLKKKTNIKKTDSAREIGKVFGEKMLKKGFNKIVFDRGGYRYHGRVKALAEGLRAAGVKF